MSEPTYRREEGTYRPVPTREGHYEDSEGEGPYQVVPIEHDYDSEDDDSENINNNEKESNEKEQVIGSSTLYSAMFNLISNRLQAPGLLAIPKLIQYGGVIALVVLVLVPCLCVYTGKILIDCMYDTSSNQRKRIRNTYKDLGAACWPKYGGTVVLVTHVLQVGMTASYYFVFAATFLLETSNNFPVSKSTLLALTALICLPAVYIRKFSHVSWLSLMAIIALLVSLAATLVYCHEKLTTNKSWKLENMNVWQFDWVLLALNIVALSSTHGVLPTLETSLKEKSHFNKVLGTTYALCMFVMLVFSLVAYFAFHRNLQPLLVHNLPPGGLSTAIEVFLFFNSILCFPFIILVLINIIENCIFPPSLDKKHVWPSCNVLRASLVLLVLFPAIAIPHYAELFVFVGSYANIAITFILPCVFHLKLKGDEISMCQKSLNGFIILGGVIIAVTGAIFGGKNLIEATFFVKF